MTDQEVLETLDKLYQQLDDVRELTSEAVRSTVNILLDQIEHACAEIQTEIAEQQDHADTMRELIGSELG